MFRNAFVLAALLGSVSVGHALVLDDFSSGLYDSGNVTATTIAWQNGSMAGGVRGTYIGFQANPLSEDARLRITPTGLAVASSGVQADNFFQLAYGYANGSTVNGSNALNLNLTSNSLLKVDFIFNDLPQTLNVFVFSSTGSTSATYSAAIPAGINSPTSFLVNISSFSQLADVDSIVFTYDTSASGDFAVTQLEAVPEPATLAVLGLGAAALIRRRRK